MIWETVIFVSPQPYWLRLRETKLFPLGPVIKCLLFINQINKICLLMTNWRTIKLSKTRFYMKPHQENVQLINVKDLYHKTIMALSYCKQQYKHSLKVYLEKQYHFKAKNQYLHVIISLEENLTVQKMKLLVINIYMTCTLI